MQQQVQDQYKQQFQAAQNISYADQVQTDFTIKYQQLSYEEIQKSATAMRNMMKKVSGILDQKLHKYYGMMGEKHIPEQSNIDKLLEKYRKELQTNEKLIENQNQQIVNIEKLDKQFASSKRIEKQADRLRQYFETKKSMGVSQKDSRFTRGEVSKNGQYLARDLDSQKHYFRLNKIKEYTEYAMLKEKQLIKQQQIKLQKLQQSERKFQEMNIECERHLALARQQKLVIVDNKQIYDNYNKIQKRKKQVEQKTKNCQILENNFKQITVKLFTEVQMLKTKQKEQNQKYSEIQQKINQFKELIASTVEKNKELNTKMDQSMLLKNVQILIKGKETKNNQESIMKEKQIQIKPITLSDSKIISKPNFKIKPFLMSPKGKSTDKKNNLGKSLDMKSSMNLPKKSIPVLWNRKSASIPKIDKINKSNNESPQIQDSQKSGVLKNSKNSSSRRRPYSKHALNKIGDKKESQQVREQQFSIQDDYKIPTAEK